jgi:hypothetical protein
MGRKPRESETDRAAPTVTIPGCYERVLRQQCRLDAQDRCVDGLADSGDPQAEAEAIATAKELYAERAGWPLEVASYVFGDAALLPLPKPFDETGSGRGPRRLRVWPDDRIDAAEWAAGVAAKYERARHFPGCDHAYFQSAEALSGRIGD